MAKRRKFSSEPFDAALERLMTESGTTYRGLAAKTELSAGYLNHLVHGNRPVPSNDVLKRLADAFGVGPEYFRGHRLRMITERLEAQARPRRRTPPPQRLTKDISAERERGRLQRRDRPAAMASRADRVSRCWRRLRASNAAIFSVDSST
jgi:transcriptional regulator with XRE-family HTH domain